MAALPTTAAVTTTASTVSIASGVTKICLVGLTAGAVAYVRADGVTAVAKADGCFAVAPYMETEISIPYSTSSTNISIIGSGAMDVHIRADDDD